MKLGIKKIEYKLPGGAWTELNIVHLSGGFEEETKKEAAGLVSTVDIKAEMRRSRTATDDLLRRLTRAWCGYRVTDMNGVVYTIDSPEYRPALTWGRSINKLNPNGYELHIVYKSVEGPVVSE